jgi:hypothetical protein
MNDAIDTARRELSYISTPGICIEDTVCTRALHLKGIGWQKLYIVR